MVAKTIQEVVVGKTTLRLLANGGEYVGIAFVGIRRGEPIRGPDAERVWDQLRRSAGEVSPAYFGYDGARARFLRMFPEGFEGEQFCRHELDYKVAASRLLAETLPLEEAACATTDHCEAVARVFGRTNLLSPFEQSRVREALRGASGPAFIGGAAALALGDVSGGLRDITAATRDYGPLSWPIATYLPFLWRPDTEMFLKPQVTRDFAERVGHPFAHPYRAQLDPEVYLSLLDLAAETEQRLAGMGVRDRIDVQSYIWVVGAYTDADAEAQRAGA